MTKVLLDSTVLIDVLRGRPAAERVRRREATIAGRWRRMYAERGRTLAQADCLVAAACASAGAVLASANIRDFPMDEIRVEEWPVGR